MDPNVTLAAFRAAVQRWQEAAVAEADAERHAAATEALEAATQLDQWLSRGGFLPTAWQPEPATRPVDR